MGLTLEQIAALERGIARVGGKYALGVAGIISTLLAAYLPDSKPMKAAALVIVGLSLLSLWLTARCLRLEKQLKTESKITPELMPPTLKEPIQTQLSPEAFAILCWIFDEDGEVTMERIVEKLKITKPEAKMHLMRLYEKCFISDIDHDHLDAPEGYQINSDGTEYVLKYRGRAEAG